MNQTKRTALQDLIVFFQEESFLTEMRQTAKKHTHKWRLFVLFFKKICISIAKFLIELSILPVSWIFIRENYLLVVYVKSLT